MGKKVSTFNSQRVKTLSIAEFDKITGFGLEAAVQGCYGQAELGRKGKPRGEKEEEEAREWFLFHASQRMRWLAANRPSVRKNLKSADRGDYLEEGLIH